MALPGTRAHSAIDLPHPVHQLAEMLPEMDDPQFGELVASIRERGFDPAHPVVLWRGHIVDGRHRARAAEVLGIEYPTTEYDGKDDDLRDWIIQENVIRRHLTDAHRAIIADSIMTTRHGTNQHTRSDDDIDRQLAAELFGVSFRSLSRASKLRRTGDQEAIQSVIRDKAGLDTALRAAQARRRDAPDDTDPEPAAASPTADQLRLAAAAASLAPEAAFGVRSPHDTLTAAMRGVGVAVTDDTPAAILLDAAGAAPDPSTARAAWASLAPGGVLIVHSGDDADDTSEPRTSVHLSELLSLGGQLGRVVAFRSAPRPGRTLIAVHKPS